MALSRSILKNFAKVTNDRATKTNTNTYVYATAVVGDDGSKYVKMDGSNQVTPVSRLTDIEDGDRVMVSIQDHKAVVMGNLSYPPSAREATNALNAANQSYAEVENLRATMITTDTLVAEVAKIGYLTADEANIAYAKITELDAVKANIEEIEAKSITTEYLEAEVAKLGYVTANQIEAQYVKAEELEAKVGTFGYLKADEIEAAVGNFGYVKAEELEAVEGKIDTLTSKSITTDNLSAKVADLGYATVEYLDAELAEIDTLFADYATINQLNALEANINEAFIGYAKVVDLEAAKADIDVLDANYANIETLLSGNVSSGSLQSIVLNSSNATIANGTIKSAMIESLTFDKITGFDINTTNLTIHSEDGKSKWSDNTIQISDANRVRVQIGKDASDDYSMSVWDAEGKLIWDALGATENTIQRAIIRDNVIAADADIDGSKLNINSVVSEINGATTKLKSTTIFLDETNQTLDVSFKSLETTVGDLETTTETQATNISVMQGQISSLIAKDTEIENALGDKVTTSQYNSIKATVDSHTQTIGSHTTQLNTQSGQISAVDTRVTEVKQDLDTWSAKLTSTQSDLTALTSRVTTNETSITALQGEIALKVSQTEVDAAIDGIEIGGRNLWLYTKEYDTSAYIGWVDNNDANRFITSAPYAIVNGFGVQRIAHAWHDVSQRVAIEPNTYYTLSAWIKWDSSVGVMRFFSDGTSPSSLDVTDQVGIDEYKRVVATFYSNETTMSVCRFECTTDTPYLIYGLKLEKGTKATDWTPAPEDVDAKFANYSTTTQMVAEITASKNSILSTVSETYTTILQRNADQQALTSYKNEVNQKLTKDGIVSTVGSYYATLEDIDVGGRNLVANSDVVKSGTGTLLYNLTDYGKTLAATVDETFIISFDAYASVSTKIDAYLRSSSASVSKIPTAQTITTTKKRYYFKTTISTANSAITACVRHNSSVSGYVDGTVYISNMKVEKGNIATDWTPAPEDNLEYIASVETIATQTKERFSWLVKNPDTATDTTFELTDRVASLTAEYINLNGLVTFSGLGNDAQNKINTAQSTADSATTKANNAQTSVNTLTTNLATAGKTTINGANITTGKIDADRIDVDNLFAGTITINKDGTASKLSIENYSITWASYGYSNGSMTSTSSVGTFKSLVFSEDIKNLIIPQYVKTDNVMSSYLSVSTAAYIKQAYVEGTVYANDLMICNTIQTYGDLAVFGSIYEGGTALSNKYASLYNPTFTGKVTIGSSNQSTAPGTGIHVHDLRNATITAGSFGNHSVNFYFCSTGVWKSIMHITGWAANEGYAAHQLAFNAESSVNDKNLYHRTGVNDTWQSWRTILDSANYSSFCAPASHTHNYLETMYQPITSTSGDTTSAWAGQQNKITWYQTAGLINGQPSQYGLMLNMAYAGDVAQIWHVQAQGDLCHRGGNDSGWGSWKTLLDSSNVASYALPISGGTLTGNLWCNYNVYVGSNSSMVGTNGGCRVYFGVNAMKPVANNSYASGTSDYRWTTVYTVNAVNTSSDEREKDILTDIKMEDFSSYFMSLEPILYRWNYGNDRKIHFGLGAQTSERKFIAAGYSPNEFGMIYHDYFEETTPEGMSDRYSMDYQAYGILTMMQTQKNTRDINTLQNGVLALNLSMTNAEQSIEQLKHQYLSQEERMQYIIQQLQQAQAEIGQLQTQLKALA